MKYARFRFDVISAFIVLLCLTVSLCSCAPKTRTLPPPEPLSSKAELTYQYLLYQAYLSKLRNFFADDASKKDMAEALGYQERAAEALDNVLAVYPAPQIFLDKAELYWNPQQIAVAVAILKPALTLYPGNRELTTALADAYSAQNRLDATIVTLSDYLEIKPKDRGMRRHLAQVLVRRGDHARAMDVIAPLKDLETDPEALHIFARAAAGIGHTAKAVEALEKALAVAPDYAEAWAELAYVHELNKEYDKAAETYERMLELGDPNQDVLLRLIHLHLKMNEPGKALNLVLERSSSKAFLMEAARLFVSEGFYAQASAVLDVLESGTPGSPELLFFRAAVAFEGENDPEKALGYLAAIPEDNQYFERSLIFRINLLHSLDRRQEALDLIRKGQAMFPGNRTLLLLEAGCYEDAGEPGEALPLLRDLSAKWPGDIEIMYRLGIVLEKTGRRDQAMEVMEDLIVRDPDNPDALNFVGYTLAEEGRELDRAEVLIKKALEQNPDSGYIMDSLAWVYFKQGRTESAWEEIRRATAVVDDPVIWEHYGDIAAAAGNRKQARRGYEKSLKLGSKDKDRINEKLDAL